MKDPVRRAREIRAENEKRGFKVVGTYWTQGQYDIVSLVEAPSEAAMLAGGVHHGERGGAAARPGVGSPQSAQSPAGTPPSTPPRRRSPSSRACWLPSPRRSRIRAG